MANKSRKNEQEGKAEVDSQDTVKPVELKSTNTNKLDTNYKAIYRKPAGGWKQSSDMKGSLERKYTLAECLIPIEDVDRIIAYKRLKDSGIIPTEAEMVRVGILHG